MPKFGDLFRPKTTTNASATTDATTPTQDQNLPQDQDQDQQAQNQPEAPNQPPQEQPQDQQQPPAENQPQQQGQPQPQNAQENTEAVETAAPKKSVFDKVTGLFTTPPAEPLVISAPQPQETVVGDGGLPTPPPSPKVLQTQDLPSFFQENQALGTITPKTVNGGTEVTTVLNGLLPAGTAQGVDAIAPALEQNFESFLGDGRKFQIKVGKQFFEANVQAVMNTPANEAAAITRADHADRARAGQPERQLDEHLDHAHHRRATSASRASWRRVSAASASCRSRCRWAGPRTRRAPARRSVKSARSGPARSRTRTSRSPTPSR